MFGSRKLRLQQQLPRAQLWRQAAPDGGQHDDGSKKTLFQNCFCIYNFVRSTADFFETQWGEVTCASLKACSKKRDANNTIFQQYSSHSDNNQVHQPLVLNYRVILA